MLSSFMATQTDNSLREAAEFGLFFLFIALNLVWFALRNISIAVDEYVTFEVLETVRRAGYFIGLAAVLFGLPLIVMLMALNALWAVVLTVCIRRMIGRGALIPRIGGTVAHLRSFVRANRAELVRSGTYAASEIYTYNYPYLIIPMLFGLGAPPIILDTTFKVFRGGSVIFGAVCDILVPRQTSALAERDGPTLVRATVLAAALCALPAGIISAILLIGADRIFAILLGNAATMPAAATPILIVLLFIGPHQNGHPQRPGAQRLLQGRGAHRHGRGHGDDRRWRLRHRHPPRYRAFPGSLCRGLCLRRGRGGGDDGARAVPPRASGRANGAGGDALVFRGGSAAAPEQSEQRADLGRRTPQHRRLLDPALEPIGRPHRRDSKCPAPSGRGDIVVQLKLGVAPIAFIALVADGEIENAKSAIDRQIRIRSCRCAAPGP